MKFLYLLPALTLIGCSSMESNCSGTKNWFEEGRQSSRNGSAAESYLQLKQINCEDQISAEAISQFNKGRDYQKIVNCTGGEAYSKEGWSGLGHELALKGEAETAYQEMRNKCGINPTNEELKTYKSAYQKSLATVCSKIGGMDFARKGYVYKGTCPKSAEKNFFTGNQVGNKMKETDELSAKIKEQNQAIDKLLKENHLEEETVSLCSERLARGEKSGEVQDRTYHQCYTSSPAMAQTYLDQSRKKIRDNGSKILDLRGELENQKNLLNQKYKEIEIINGLLK